jgi:DNA-binding response OmpR family regulator
VEIPNLTGKTILIVDDDAGVVAGLGTALSVTGATIKTATDGNSAVDVCLASPPNIMILDMMLPKRSGFLVLERINASLPAEKRPHTIMITANPGTRHKHFAETLGIADYISKPFTVDRLIRTLARLYPPQTSA